MKKDPACLACEKFGPPKWNPSTEKFDHVIPYAGPYGRSDKAIDCPASIINAHWAHGKRLDR